MDFPPLIAPAQRFEPTKFPWISSGACEPQVKQQRRCRPKSGWTPVMEFHAQTACHWRQHQPGFVVAISWPSDARIEPAGLCETEIASPADEWSDSQVFIPTRHVTPSHLLDDTFRVSVWLLELGGGFDLVSSSGERLAEYLVTKTPARRGNATDVDGTEKSEMMLTYQLWTAAVSNRNVHIFGPLFKAFYL